MSLGIAVKGPDCVVLGADTRVTLMQQAQDGTKMPVNFDNATKLFSFKNHKHVGVVTYGQAVIGLRTAHSFLPEFELELDSKTDRDRTSIKKYAEQLSNFYLERWNEFNKNDYQGPDMVFIVGGYSEGQAYGEVYVVSIPSNPEPVEQNPKNNFGMTWGGQLQVASRLIHGYDPKLLDVLETQLDLNQEDIHNILKKIKKSTEFQIPYQILSLQDSVDLAIFILRTTIDAQSLALGIRGVGGMIEVAAIQRESEFKYIQKKKIHGEFDQSWYTQG